MQERTIWVVLWTLSLWALPLIGAVDSRRGGESYGDGRIDLDTPLGVELEARGLPGYPSPGDRVETTPLFPSDFGREKISIYRKGVIGERKNFPSTKKTLLFSEFLERLERDRNEAETEMTEDPASSKAGEESEPVPEKPDEQTDKETQKQSTAPEASIDETASGRLTTEEKILLQSPLFPRPYERSFSTERLLLYFPVTVEGEGEEGKSTRILVPVETGVPFIPPITEYPRSTAKVKEAP
mgnify:FL=1